MRRGTHAGGRPHSHLSSPSLIRNKPAAPTTPSPLPSQTARQAEPHPTTKHQGQHCYPLQSQYHGDRRQLSPRQGRSDCAWGGWPCAGGRAQGGLQADQVSATQHAGQARPGQARPDLLPLVPANQLTLSLLASFTQPPSPPLASQIASLSQEGRRGGNYSRGALSS